MENEFKVIHLTKKEQKQRRKRALRYFAAYGINPDTKGNTHQDRILDMPPKPFWKKDDENTITYQCKVSVESFLFYTHVEVNFTDNEGNEYKYEGGSGGLGLGTVTGVGAIYFGNQETLLKATTFGVFFGADAAGAVQVTWGTSGNATVAGDGMGAGAFGGSGGWTKE